MPVRNSPVTILCTIVLLFSPVMVAGCTLPAGKHPAMSTVADSCTPADNLPHHGGLLLLNETERRRTRMNSSEYSHTTFVNENDGTCTYDCSGFVGYALSRADPCA